jgi:nicotinamidase-related amidase
MIIPELFEYASKSRVINKITFGYYAWMSIFGAATDIEEFEICGLCTDICVVSNALLLRSLYPNHKITVDASCCAGVTPEKHVAALEVMKSCQIDVINE